MKMHLRAVTIGICLFTLPGIIGCGGGGSSSSSTSKNAKAHARMTATARMSRSVLAVTGLGRSLSKGVTLLSFKGFGSRITEISGMTASRGVTPILPTPVLDPGTGLYYITQVNPDGSGKQLLFVDIGMTKPAGSFQWAVPVYASINPPTYPKTITVTYSITAGKFAGLAGTMRIKINDANFSNGLIELVLTDALHESAQASFNVSQEGITGTQQIDLGNGDNCSVSDSTDSSGIWIDVFTFPDGASVDVNTQPDGTSTDTYTDPSTPADGGVDASSVVQSDGTDNITYSTGETETVNVDPGSSDGSSSDSSNTDNTDTSKRVKRGVVPRIPRR